MKSANPHAHSKHFQDKSNGWEACARQLITGRQQTRIGAQTIAAWAQTLPRDAVVLDLGCGCGVPVSEQLLMAGLKVYGIDASPTLAAEFQRRFPEAEIACEAVEESVFSSAAFLR
jgi:2-polyprenyl-3-methyl-5-hydroxy-6-metoxy-1,4-benzoquinol methylase